MRGRGRGGVLACNGCGEGRSAEGRCLINETREADEQLERSGTVVATMQRRGGPRASTEACPGPSLAVIGETRECVCVRLCLVQEKQSREASFLLGFRVSCGQLETEKKKTLWLSLW